MCVCLLSQYVSVIRWYVLTVPDLFLSLFNQQELQNFVYLGGVCVIDCECACVYVFVCISFLCISVVKRYVLTVLGCFCA